MPPPRDASLRPLAERIGLFLSKQTQPIAPPEIATALGLREAPIRRTLGNMVSLGEVRRAGGGLFTMAAHRRRKDEGA